MMATNVATGLEIEFEDESASESTSFRIPHSALRIQLVWSAQESNQRKADRLPHEAGLKLLSTPRAPKELPAMAFIRNSHGVADWKPFVED